MLGWAPPPSLFRFHFNSSSISRSSKSSIWNNSNANHFSPPNRLSPSPSALTKPTEASNADATPLQGKPLETVVEPPQHWRSKPHRQKLSRQHKNQIQSSHRMLHSVRSNPNLLLSPPAESLTPSNLWPNKRVKFARRYCQAFTWKKSSLCFGM